MTITKKLPKKVQKLLFDLLGFTLDTYGTGYNKKKPEPKEAERWKFKHFNSWDIELARVQNNRPLS